MEVIKHSSDYRASDADSISKVAVCSTTVHVVATPLKSPGYSFLCQPNCNPSFGRSNSTSTSTSWQAFSRPVSTCHGPHFRSGSRQARGYGARQRLSAVHAENDVFDAATRTCHYFRRHHAYQCPGIFPSSAPWIALFSTATVIPALVLIAWQFDAFGDRRWQDIFAATVLGHGAYLATTLPTFGVTSPAIMVSLVIVTVLTVLGFGMLMSGEARIYLKIVFPDPIQRVSADTGCGTRDSVPCRGSSS